MVSVQTNLEGGIEHGTEAFHFGHFHPMWQCVVVGVLSLTQKRNRPPNMQRGNAYMQDFVRIRTSTIQISFPSDVATHLKIE